MFRWSDAHRTNLHFTLANIPDGLYPFKQTVATLISLPSLYVKVPNQSPLAGFPPLSRRTRLVRWRNHFLCLATLIIAWNGGKVKRISEDISIFVELLLGAGRVGFQDFRCQFHGAKIMDASDEIRRASIFALISGHNVRRNIRIQAPRPPRGSCPYSYRLRRLCPSFTPRWERAPISGAMLASPGLCPVASILSLARLVTVIIRYRAGACQGVYWTDFQYGAQNWVIMGEVAGL